MEFNKGDKVRFTVYTGREPIVAKATYNFLEKSKTEGTTIPFVDRSLEVRIDDIVFLAKVNAFGKERMVDGLSVLDMIFQPEATFNIEVSGELFEREK